MSLRDWLRQPIQLTRRVALVCGLLLGVLTAGGILGVAFVADDIKDDKRTNAEVAAIARRIFHIERPSSREIQRRVMQQLRLCAKRPACLRSLNTTVLEATELVADQGLDDSPAGGRPGERGSAPPSSSPPSSSPRAPAPPGSTPTPNPPPTPAPRPPSAPPAPQPPRIFDLDLPPVGPVELPRLCTPVAGVNCR